jgi:hypothetical protein
MLKAKPQRARSVGNRASAMVLAWLNQRDEPPIQPVHLGCRKVTPGTGGMFRIYLTVHGKVQLSDNLQQIIHQFPERQHLVRGRAGSLEIAHKTDADRDLVNLFSMDMASLQLLEPSSANLNFAISGIDAIADYKMIRQAVFHAAFPVLPVVNRGIAIRDSTMVSHHPTPPTRHDVETFGLCSHPKGESR